MGWSCGDENNSEYSRQTITKTGAVVINPITPGRIPTKILKQCESSGSVTVTTTRTTLPSQNGLQVEPESRGPVRKFTATKEKSPEGIYSTERPSKESAPTTINLFRESAQSGVGGWEWMINHSVYSPSPTKSTTIAPSSSPVHTTTRIVDDETSSNCPVIKPILEVSCVDRPRLLWNDFKITWGPAWNDQSGCRRLYKEMDKRGLVTGFHCSQIADLESNTWIMEARGHRPRFPKTLVADAIRATFSVVSAIHISRLLHLSIFCIRDTNNGHFFRIIPYITVGMKQECYVKGFEQGDFYGNDIKPLGEKCRIESKRLTS